MLCQISDTWTSNKNYIQRVNDTRDLLGGNVFDDGEFDVLSGAGKRDWYFQGVGDELVDLKNDELVN